MKTTPTFLLYTAKVGNHTGHPKSLPFPFMLSFCRLSVAAFRIRRAPLFQTLEKTWQLCFISSCRTMLPAKQTSQQRLLWPLGAQSQSHIHIPLPSFMLHPKPLQPHPTSLPLLLRNRTTPHQPHPQFHNPLFEHLLPSRGIFLVHGESQEFTDRLGVVCEADEGKGRGARGMGPVEGDGVFGGGVEGQGRID